MKEQKFRTYEEYLRHGVEEAITDPRPALTSEEMRNHMKRTNAERQKILDSAQPKLAGRSKAVSDRQ